MAVRTPLVIVAGQIQRLQTGDTLASVNSNDPIKSSFSGTLINQVGTVRYYHPITTTLTGIYFSLGTASLAGNVTIDLLKNGISVMAGNYPTVIAGGYLSNVVAISTALTTTDYLTINIILSGGSAADMTVYITK